MLLTVAAARQSCVRGSLYGYSALRKPSVALSNRPCLHAQRRLLHESRRLQEDSDSTKEAKKPAKQSKQQGGSKAKSRVVSKQEFLENLEQYKKYFTYPTPAGKERLDTLQLGDVVTLHGFLSARRVQHSKLVFADLAHHYVSSIQVTSDLSTEVDPEAMAEKNLRGVPLHSPVAVTGKVAEVLRNPTPGGSRVARISLDLERIQVLNPFPKDIIVSQGAQFPPSARHLQMRFSPVLQHRLQFRRDVMRLARGKLHGVGFREYETPMLFKSTPEGAREFLVPTRKYGFAYALPQSPQQYKQLLMASGVNRYMQFARCFRDEDLRADRQPEFTQLDLEMAFSDGEEVMRTVENMVRALVRALFTDRYEMQQIGGERVPVLLDSRPPLSSHSDKKTLRPPIFPRVTYQEAMEKYGSDKPDLRVPFDIQRIDPSVLTKGFLRMMTDLQDPAVEAIKFRPAKSEVLAPEDVRVFIHKFMESLPDQLRRNPDGAPAVMVFNSSKPLNGLSPLGYEGLANLTSLPAFSDLTDGDVVILQARRNEPFRGGSTPLGTFRNLLYAEAVSEGFLPEDTTLNFLWVTEFPMFTPDTGKGDGLADPGQGGTAGFSATHHPFTAPLTDADFDLLATDPLKAKADHYDLVVNGVELGGGSRRIHVAAVQEYVMRDILRMSDAGVAQFAHLLEALRAGCPPHAGFALGFDRFVAVLSGTNSVRDVILFPKSMKGEDLMVKAPSQVTTEQLRTYHLRTCHLQVRSGKE